MMETTPLLRRPTYNRCPLGLLAVTASALVFGVVACMVKVVALPPLVMLQCRSFVQWALSLASVALCARGATSVEPSPSPKPGSVWPERLFGPPPAKLTVPCLNFCRFPRSSGILRFCHFAWTFGSSGAVGAVRDILVYGWVRATSLRG